MKSSFLTRVKIKNYKSIAACNVGLNPLTFLIGPNGAGKSNFLDAIRFVSDSLNSPIDHALRDRGGLNEVRRKSTGHPTHFAISLSFRDKLWHGNYSFEIGAESSGGFSIRRELCRVYFNGRWQSFHVNSGKLISPKNTDSENIYGMLPSPYTDRLYLVTASGLPGFREVFDSLTGMAFYNLNPKVMRDLQSPDSRGTLLHDGANLAGVYRQLSSTPKAKNIIEEYLTKVVPGIKGVEFKSFTTKETLEFLQEVPGSERPWRFYANSMSDGTLRAFGTLVALFQSGNFKHPIPFIGIEEPETALHPAASGILRDCLKEASQNVQVAVTSHSPELLDDFDIPVESLLAVVSEQGETKIGEIDFASRKVLREKLFSPGELLKLDQIRPEPTSLPNYTTLDLFSK